MTQPARKYLFRSAYLCIEELTENVHTYHVRMRMLEDGFQVQQAMKGAMYYEEGNPISEILRIILEMNGVASAALRAYTITIEKGVMFYWKEIDYPIAEFLTNIHGVAEIENPMFKEELRQILNDEELGRTGPWAAD